MARGREGRRERACVCRVIWIWVKLKWFATTLPCMLLAPKLIPHEILVKRANRCLCGLPFLRPRWSVIGSKYEFVRRCVTAARGSTQPASICGSEVCTRTHSREFCELSFCMLNVRYNTLVHLYIEIDIMCCTLTVQFRGNVEYDLVERFDSTVRLTLVRW